MGARRYRTLCRQVPAALAGGSMKQGYTLLETGFVIGLMGLLILLMSNHLLEQSQRIIPRAQPHQQQQADEIVRDIWRIARAAQLYAGRNGIWPNDGTNLDVNALGPSSTGYLAEVPTVPDHGSSCNLLTRYPPIRRDPNHYHFSGWKRFKDPSNPKQAFSTKPSYANDLVIEFCIKGDRTYAESIASRIPFGHVGNSSYKPTLGTFEFDMEARVLRESSTMPSSSYVRETNEDQTVVAELIALQNVEEANYDSDTKIDLEGQKNIDAGVWASSGVHNAYFNLTSRSITPGSFNSPEPTWEIKDLVSSGGSTTSYEGLWTLAGLEGQTTTGTTATITYAPSVSAKVEKGGTAHDDMVWRIEYLPESSTTSSTDPAVFDLYLTSDTPPTTIFNQARTCHLGIHAQLCEFEREMHEVLKFAEDNNKFGYTGHTPPAYTETGLEDAACRSEPSC